MPVIALPDGIRAKVQRLNADLINGLLVPGTAVWLACDLLVAGVETPAVMELAGESPTGLTRGDAEPLVRRMLSEMGIEPLDTGQAAWIVARDIARQMVDGGLPAEDGAAMLWGLWWDCDNAPEIGIMVQPLDEWQETPPGHRDDEAIRGEMRRLAPAVIRAADRWLAGEATPDP